MTIWVSGGAAQSNMPDSAVSITPGSNPRPVSILTANPQFGSDFTSFEMLYAGDAPGQPSDVMQVNFRLPTGPPTNYQIQIGEEMAPFRCSSGSVIGRRLHASTEIAAALTASGATQAVTLKAQGKSCVARREAVQQIFAKSMSEADRETLPEIKIIVQQKKDTWQKNYEDHKKAKAEAERAVTNCEDMLR